MQGDARAWCSCIDPRIVPDDGRGTTIMVPFVLTRRMKHMGFPRARVPQRCRTSAFAGYCQCEAQQRRWGRSCLCAGGRGPRRGHRRGLARRTRTWHNKIVGQRRAWHALQSDHVAPRSWAAAGRLQRHRSIDGRRQGCTGGGRQHRGHAAPATRWDIDPFPHGRHQLWVHTVGAAQGRATHTRVHRCTARRVSAPVQRLVRCKHGG